MSRIATPAVDTATGATAEVYGMIKKAVGKVPNAYAAIGALAPEALKVMLQADGVSAGGTLSKQEREIIKVIVSEVGGCDYCVAAHVMLGKMAGLKAEALKKMRAGEAATGDAKLDALVHFVTNVVRKSGTVSNEEFAAIKAAGYTDVQMAEIALSVAVITFTNVFNRINDTDVDFPAAD